MKLISPIFQLYAFMAILLLESIKVSAQSFSPFRSQYVGNGIILMDTILIQSDTISLTNYGTIYSLSIDATIQQPRESSFVRIVLEDTSGHDYLVAESDWFRNDTTIVELEGYCEETTRLNGITPTRLKCYLNNAELALHSLLIANTPIISAPQIPTDSIKKMQVQAIVDRINSYNEKHCKLWRAGLTQRSLTKYEDREKYGLEHDTYLANIIYYDSGIYEMGERPSAIAPSTSLYAPSFRWDNRHGRNWMTIPKNQWDSGWCVAFGTCSVLEGLMNLQYNDTLNLNLSEADIAYNNGRQPYKNGTHMMNGLQTVKIYGVIDEDAYPFIPDSTQGWPLYRPEGSEYIQITNYAVYYPQFYGGDGLKQILINHGPCVTGYPGHAMALVGYDKVTTEDIYIVYDSPNGRIDSTDYQELIGKEYWIFKDSYYEHPDPYFETIYGKHSGYQYIIFNKDSYRNLAVYVLGKLSSQSHSDSDIIVEDLDGDGYYNWGIGPKPTHAPEWIPEESDGDDSDPLIGPMDEYGNMETLNTEPSLTIWFDFVFDDNYHLTQNGIIENNATITITGNVIMSRMASITIQPGSTLIIDGGCLRNANIHAEPGSSIIIKNGGRIITHARDNFNIPLGVNLMISEGYIE